MEKKTIGKFIAVLRKANGMTQKELGDKLFVSDKTVSRWECDECTPELSLIPAIAEIFGITTDELLRGERNAPDSGEDSALRQKKKSEKQFKAMLFGKKRKFNNLTLISIGISLFGLIVGMIINLGFSKGLIAFFVTSAFLLAGVICQICFTANARIATGDDDDYRELTDEANTSFLQRSISVYFVNIAIFAFCLPLVTLINGANFGLTFDSWLLYGTLYAMIGTVALYLIYRIFIVPVLADRNLLILNEKATLRAAYKRNLLIRLSAFSAAIALLLGVAIFVINCLGAEAFADKIVLESPEEFKEYMETSYDEAKYTDGNWYYVVNGNMIGSAIISDGDDAELYKYFDTLLDKQGNVLCEYYYHSELYSSIKYSTDSDDRCPITVYTRAAMREANNRISNIESALYFAIAVEIAVFAVVYVVKVIKKRD